MNASKKGIFIFAAILIFCSSLTTCSGHKHWNGYLDHPGESTLWWAKVLCKGGVSALIGYWAFAMIPVALQSPLKHYLYINADHFFRTMLNGDHPIAKWIAFGCFGYCAYRLGMSCINNIRYEN